MHRRPKIKVYLIFLHVWKKNSNLFFISNKQQSCVFFSNFFNCSLSGTDASRKLLNQHVPAGLQHNVLTFTSW